MEYFLGVITRCKDEIYIDEFVNYYLNEGVDKIMILDDNSSNKDIYKNIINNEKIIIIFDNNVILKRSIYTLYKSIQTFFEWIIYIDIDEFITTKKNQQNTIRDELLTTYKDAMCVKIPWVMMSCNKIQYNPKSLLETNIYRWNHNKRHINLRSNEPKFRCRYDKIEVKCIFKPRYFGDLNDHHPIKPIVKNPIIIESIHNKLHPLDPHYNNLRENDITNGFLLCYHYRIISVENCLLKIKNNIWYKRYTLNDLLSNDYAEIIDETLKNKIPKQINYLTIENN
jgi:hypothetical protein